MGGSLRVLPSFTPVFPWTVTLESIDLPGLEKLSGAFLAPLRYYIGLTGTEKLSVEAGSAMSNFYHDFSVFDQLWLELTWHRTATPANILCCT